MRKKESEKNGQTNGERGCVLSLHVYVLHISCTFYDSKITIILFTCWSWRKIVYSIYIYIPPLFTLAFSDDRVSIIENYEWQQQNKAQCDTVMCDLMSGVEKNEQQNKSLDCQLHSMQHSIWIGFPTKYAESELCTHNNIFLHR